MSPYPIKSNAMKECEHSACSKYLFLCYDEKVNYEEIILDLKFRSMREMIKGYKNWNSYFVISNSIQEMLKRLNEIDFLNETEFETFYEIDVENLCQ